jgi:acrylyl-CoA reductase (NADPH)
MDARFMAYRIFAERGGVAARFVELTLDQLDPGEVVIRTVYSSLNYKDALAASGTGKVIRRFPCVGGVDAAGVVDSSRDDRFKPGDVVIATGYGMGVDHDGGFARYVRVPADWVVPLPQGLSLFEAMVLGTAGFTAALALRRMEQNELAPQNGKVIVTGATGGVGSLSIRMLAQLGYHVVAMTGKDGEHAYLKALGASEVLARSAVDLDGGRALESAQWAGALDALGGSTLAWLTRSMRQDGVIASYGNAGGAELHTTVYPFILRGVRLLGIDSAAAAMPLRESIWRDLAGRLRLRDAGSIAHPIPFSQLPVAIGHMLSGRSMGRVVVEFGPR